MSEISRRDAVKFTMLAAQWAAAREAADAAQIAADEAARVEQALRTRLCDLLRVYRGASDYETFARWDLDTERLDRVINRHDSISGIESLLP